MTTVLRMAFVHALALCVAAMAAPAWARNTEHLLPIQATLATPEARAAIGSDIAVSFGAAMPDGHTIVNDRIVARGKVDPRRWMRQGPPTLTDHEACAGAFIAAVADLVQQARKAGATSVLGIVSNYDERERDSTEQYECRSGQTRSVVDLKAVLAVPGRPDAPTLIGKGSVSSRHRSPIPPASGFAEVDNLDALPLSALGKERYRYYLNLPAPKAFVIYDTGAWRFYHADPDAMTKALDYCEQAGKTCWLYAVDHRVVWHADPAKRTGRTVQLGNE